MGFTSKSGYTAKNRQAIHTGRAWGKFYIASFQLFLEKTLKRPFLQFLLSILFSSFLGMVNKLKSLFPLHSCASLPQGLLWEQILKEFCCLAARALNINKPSTSPRISRCLWWFLMTTMTVLLANQHASLIADP